MTTSIAGQDVAPEVAARTRLAWREYQDAIRDRSGRAYEEAEATAWGVLQAELRLIEDPTPSNPGAPV